MWIKAFLLITFHLALNGALFAQQWQWARQAGGSGVDHGQQLAFATDSSIYLTGTFSGTAVFGTDTLVSKGKKDVFVSRFSADGSMLWTLGFGSPGMDFSYDLEADANNGVLLTGAFTDSIRFEGVLLEGRKDLDIFLVNFSKEGQLKWAKSSGDNGFDGSFGLETDQDGTIYLLSTMDENPLDSTAVSEKEYNTLHISKYSSDGEVIWQRHTKGPNRIFGNALAIDPEGNLYLTGEFKGVVVYPPDTLDEQYGIFIIKLDREGDLIWHKTLCSNHIRAFGADLVVDDSGNLYLTGGFEGIGQFGPDIMSSLGGIDIFIAQLDSGNGELKWLERAGGEQMDKGMGLCLGKNSFYLTGWYESRAYFGYDTTLVANGGNDFFIAKYNTSGELQWVNAPIAKGLGYGKAIKSDGQGNFACTGWFTGVLNFPTDLLVGSTRPDIFIAKFRDDDD